MDVVDVVEVEDGVNGGRAQSPDPLSTFRIWNMELFPSCFDIFPHLSSLELIMYYDHHGFTFSYIIHDFYRLFKSIKRVLSKPSSYK